MPAPQDPEPLDAGPDRSRIARGRWGEELATARYERAGYEVLSRNWRTRTGELDLIVGRDGLVVFCEVKARRTDRYGPAAAAVGPVKQRRIRRLAAEWLSAHQFHAASVRFDVVAVTGVQIEVIEDAF